MFAHIRHKIRSQRGASPSRTLVLLLVCAVAASVALVYNQSNQHSYTLHSKFANATFVAEPARGANIRTAQLSHAGTNAKKATSLFRASESTELSSSASKSDAQAGSADSGAQPGEGADGQGQEAQPGDGAANPEQSAPKTLSTSIKSSDGRTYTVTITYDQKANIPNGAQLIVTELNQLPSDWDDAEKQRTDYKDRPLATELLLGEDECMQRRDCLSRGLRASRL